MSELLIPGGIRARQINRDQIHQLKTNPTSSSIRKVWDALVDFFTRSNVSQAKSLCTKVFHSKDSSVKIQSFLALRSLTHKHCQSQFKIESSQQSNTIRLCITSLNISIEVQINSQDATSLMQQVDTDIIATGRAKLRQQFKGDISRWNYHLELSNGDNIELSRKHSRLTPEQKLSHWKMLSVAEDKFGTLEYLGSQLLPQSIALWSKVAEQVNCGVPNLTLVNSETAEQHCNIIDFGEGHFWVECYAHSQVAKNDLESAKIGDFCKVLTIKSGFFVTPHLTTCCYCEYKGVPI